MKSISDYHSRFWIFNYCPASQYNSHVSCTTFRVVCYLNERILLS